MYVAGTAMIAASHRPEERGRVQGAAEMSIAGIAAIASFASAGLLNGLGWAAVNIGAAPMLITAAALGWTLQDVAEALTSEVGDRYLDDDSAEALDHEGFRLRTGSQRRDSAYF